MIPSFTYTFHEHEPVQFTPCVDRTTLSCAQRPRYERSHAPSFAPRLLHPSRLIAPRRRNRWASSSGLNPSAIGRDPPLTQRPQPVDLNNTKADAAHERPCRACRLVRLDQLPGLRHAV